MTKLEVPNYAGEEKSGTVLGTDQNTTKRAVKLEAELYNNIVDHCI